MTINKQNKQDNGKYAGKKYTTYLGVSSSTFFFVNSRSQKKSYLNQVAKYVKKIFTHRTLISVNTIFHYAFSRRRFFSTSIKTEYPLRADDCIFCVHAYIAQGTKRSMHRYANQFCLPHLTVYIYHVARIAYLPRSVF